MPHTQLLRHAGKGNVLWLAHLPCHHQTPRNPLIIACCKRLAAVVYPRNAVAARRIHDQQLSPPFLSNLIEMAVHLCPDRTVLRCRFCETRPCFAGLSFADTLVVLAYGFVEHVPENNLETVGIGTTEFKKLRAKTEDRYWILQVLFTAVVVRKRCPQALGILTKNSEYHQSGT